VFNRQEVKDIFDGVDVDRSGKLDRAEFGAVAARARALSDDLIFSYYAEGLYGGLYERPYNKVLSSPQARARKFLNLSPPFDPEADWALVHHVEVGFGRVLVSETEVPNALANLV
jgi:hypothetical protein